MTSILSHETILFFHHVEIDSVEIRPILAITGQTKVHSIELSSCEGLFERGSVPHRASKLSSCILVLIPSFLFVLELKIVPEQQRGGPYIVEQDSKADDDSEYQQAEGVEGLKRLPIVCYEQDDVDT